MRKRIINVAVLILSVIPGSVVCAGNRTTVNYTVDPAYSVMIPENTSVRYNEETVPYGEIRIIEAQLDENKCIRVTMNSDGKLDNQTDGRSVLPYKILADGQPFTFAEYTEAGEETPLTIAISKEDWKKAKSGIYMDTVTFTISYVDKAE